MKARAMNKKIIRIATAVAMQIFTVAMILALFIAWLPFIIIGKLTLKILSK